MCRRTSCGACGKTTWFGCGMHVPMVMDPVKDDDRCTCEPKVDKDGKQYPPMGSVLAPLWKFLGFGKEPAARD